MKYNILAAQIKYINYNEYLSRIIDIYSMAINDDIDLIITSILPQCLFNDNLLNNTIQRLIDLTSESKVHIIIDGICNNMSDKVLLIGQGKVLKEIDKSANVAVNVMINQVGFNISFGANENLHHNKEISLILDSTLYPCMKREVRNTSLYINSIGGYDHLVFSGGSYCIDVSGASIQLGKWQESVKKFKLGLYEGKYWQLMNCDDNVLVNISQEQDTYQALMMSLHDYVNRNGFDGVILGLSGGIDSALTMMIAADALGPERVHAIMMPSCYTSDSSISDAYECANISNIKCDTIPIDGLYGPIIDSMESTLNVNFKSSPKENIQSRIRGLILMTISNQDNKMVLATGNKSELSTGYCTLYGDTCGGFAVLSDIYKTMVYKLSRWRNNNVPHNSFNPKLCVIPQSIIDKEPSAELKLNQKDSDDLPNYSILDEILIQLVDKKKSIKEIIDVGYPADVVQHIADLYLRSSFKRKQVPTGPLLHKYETHS